MKHLFLILSCNCACRIRFVLITTFFSVVNLPLFVTSTLYICPLSGVLRQKRANSFSFFYLKKKVFDLTKICCCLEYILAVKILNMALAGFTAPKTIQYCSSNFEIPCLDVRTVLRSDSGCKLCATCCVSCLSL